MKIVQNDITQLPVNETAKDMAEFLLSINLSTDKKLSYQCDNCSENQAVNWCEKCTLHLCQTCTGSIHAMRALQSHPIIPLVEKVQSICMHHPDQQFKYWCKKCQVLVCRDCLLFQHKYHTFSSLEDAASQAKAKFHETVQEIDEIMRNLTTCSETTKRIINQQREVIRQEKQDIEQTFASLQLLLEERKVEIIRQLEDNELQTMNTLNRHRVTINQHINLAIVQDLCLKEMLDSNDSMTILKFSSALYHNYSHFVEKYNKIDDGYVIKTHLLNKYDKDVQQLLGIILRFGHINSRSWMIKGDSVTIKTLSLDISRVGGNAGSIMREENIARGYKFSVKQALKLRSIQIHSDHVGQIIGFVVDDTGIIIQKGTINSTHAAMKWLRIKLKCDIQNNYTILVLPPSDNGSYTYKNDDSQLRIINQNCSVESKYVHSVTQINVDSKLTVDNSTYSIDMILDIEE
jgi:hypothetical protein